MTIYKGLDHITALFSILFIGFLAFYLVTIYPKPSHVYACALTSCVRRTISKEAPTPAQPSSQILAPVTEILAPATKVLSKTTDILH